MRSLGWALFQYDWCPYKKRKFGTHTHTQDNAKTQGGDGRLQAKEASGGTSSADTLTLDFQPHTRTANSTGTREALQETT